MTRNGNFIPNVFLGSAGHVMKAVLQIEHRHTPRVTNRQSVINKPHIGAHYLKDQRLDVIICDPLYVSISHLKKQVQSAILNTPPV